MPNTHAIEIFSVSAGQRSPLHLRSNPDIIAGTLREFCFTPSGETAGCVLDGGLEIDFPPAQARDLASVLDVGVRLEIRGWSRHGAHGELHLDPLSISVLGRSGYFDLHAHPSTHGSETSLRTAAPSAEATSLIPTSSLPGPAVSDARSGLPAAAGTVPSPPRSARSDGTQRRAADTRERAAAQQQHAARSIEAAYDGLHRTQALVAYLAIIEFHQQAVGPMLLEASNTYERALSNYERNDFPVADEFAAACVDLIHSVELIVSRILRSDPAYPRVAPPPFFTHEGSLHATETNDELERVNHLLARIRWLLDNGTLPKEDKDQICKLAAWSGAFYDESRRYLQSGAFDEAFCLAGAAGAAAQSAEHVCRQDYIAHRAPVNIPR